MPTAQRSAFRTILAVAALALLAGAPRARAASTGSTALLTPQGSAAGTANGDYVTDTADGLGTVYKYWIEVPPGLSRLVIELFDADLGAGGGAEANAGRDRDRSGGFGGTASYALYSSSGAAIPTQFSTGTTTQPTGGDNAWLTFYDSSAATRTVRDEFGVVDYGNNDGPDNWTGDWTEVNDNGTAGGGEVRVTGGELRINNDDAGTAPWIYREADLNGMGMTSATLTFDYDTANLDGNGGGLDRLVVEISGNGGSSWNNLATYTGNASGSFSSSITAYIASNTQIRFRIVNGFDRNDEFFYVDNVQISGPGSVAPVAGHWELDVGVTNGNEINALGIRAHDGTSGSGGTELNVYYDSFNQIGVNPSAAGDNTRSYDFYPYVTAACSGNQNDFDFDSNDGTVGSIGLTSRSGAFSTTIPSGSLSQNNVWDRTSFSGWTSDQLATDYGIWHQTDTINTYVNGAGINGNYATVYLGSSLVAANPPTSNPIANVFRVYFPTDAGSAPVKPYLEQLLTFKSGTNPPAVGQTARYQVTVRMVNPTSQAITFSASNLVTANVPGSGAVYAGNAAVGQGTIVSQPSVGGTGNVTWNPGTLAAGATAILTYQVDVTPTSAGQRIRVTGTPTSNGTKAVYVDETGNTTQSRATYTFGPLCELAVTQDLLTPAVVTGLRATATGSGVVATFTTASEVGAAGFELQRYDDAARRFVRVGDGFLAALSEALFGATYALRDPGAPRSGAVRYRVVERTPSGGRLVHGPWTVQVADGEEEQPGAASSVRLARAAPQPPRLATATPDAGELAAAPAAGLVDGDKGLRLAIRTAGLYHLGVDAVASGLGLDARNAARKIASGTLQLSRGGQPVAWQPELDGAGRGVGMWFYGEPVPSIYTLDTPYRLEKGPGLRMASAPAAAAASGTATTAASEDFETDAFAATVLPLDPESDYWFWQFLVAGDPAYGEREIAFTVPAPVAADPATVTLRLQGATSTGVAGEHHVRVALDGNVLGETAWEGIAAHSASFAVPGGALADGGHTLAVTALLDAGVSSSVSYVDGFAVDFTRRLEAKDGALRFAVDGGPVEVAGFAAPAVHLLDVSDPLRPRWLGTAAGEDDGAGGFRVRFTPPAGTTRVLATAAGVELAPYATRPWRRDRSLARGATYVVVTAPAMRDAAIRLARHRAAPGVSTLVADTDAIADAYGAGTFDPHALRAFVQALAASPRPPRWLVLAGAGDVDYRGILGLGENPLPPVMASSPSGLFPSDEAIGDLDGDGAPEIAVGRIPAADAAELDAYVDRVLAFDAAPAGDWTGSAVLLADRTDHAASFANDSQAIAANLASGWTTTAIDLDALPIADARSALFASLAAGAGFVDYVGHGALDRLSAEGLLTSADVPSLANAPRLPLFSALTCTVNRFAVPGFRALGEELVVGHAGGAIAVFGPTGLAAHGDSAQLGGPLARRLGDPSLTVGEAVVRAMNDYANGGGDRALLPFYALLGDPALRLHAPPPPAIVPGGGGE